MKKLLLFTLIAINCALIANSGEIEKAIAYHQPERLLKLGSVELAQLVENRNEYLTKAKESSDRAWEALRARFDLKDSARILYGGSLLALGLSALYIAYSQHIKPYIQQSVPVAVPPAVEGAEPTITATPIEIKKFSFIDMNGLCTLVGGVVGSILTGMGAFNLHKGLTKHDRFMKYYKALAVESNLQRWLSFFRGNNAERPH